MARAGPARLDPRRGGGRRRAAAGGGRRSVAEIVVHAAYWKYVVRRRLFGEKRGSFPLKGSNWFPRPTVTAASWAEDVGLPSRMHGEKWAAVLAALDNPLRVRLDGKEETVKARPHLLTRC